MGGDPSQLDVKKVQDDVSSMINSIVISFFIDTYKSIKFKFNLVQRILRGDI